MAGILWFIILAVLAFWVLGLVMNIAGGLIHILLVVALVLFVANLFLSNRNRISS